MASTVCTKRVFWTRDNTFQTRKHAGIHGHSRYANCPAAEHMRRWR